MHCVERTSRYQGRQTDFQSVWKLHCCSGVFLAGLSSGPHLGSIGWIRDRTSDHSDLQSNTLPAKLSCPLVVALREASLREQPSRSVLEAPSRSSKALACIQRPAAFITACASSCVSPPRGARAHSAGCPCTGFLWHA